MQVLLLDAGNSALKWAWIESRTGEAQAAAGAPGFPGAACGVIAYAGAGPDGAIEQAFAAICAGHTMGAVTAVGCSVAGEERVRTIDAALRALGAPAATWLATQERFEQDGVCVHNGYRRPAQLGADRWHGLLGARALHPGAAVLVVNAGTATTVDALDARGRFPGGVIAPGLELMRGALAQATAQLPLAAGQYVAHADNTDDAIRTGILDAQVGLIERRVRIAEEAFGTPLRIVLSGGHASALDALVRARLGTDRVQQEPWLVLRGLLLRAPGRVPGLPTGSERIA